MLQSSTTLKRDTSSANVTKTWHSRGLGMRYLGLHSEWSLTSLFHVMFILVESLAESFHYITRHLVKPRYLILVTR